MFSRTPSDAEGAAPEGVASAPAETTGGETARAFDQVLSELQPPGAPPAELGVAGVTASASEHAATLRATRGAHQEAQAMLAMANEARQQASEEAERIVIEARDAAERTRQEISGWAAAQRAKVDALVADLVESANKDADAIRAEALRTSMAEAEETARAYLAEAAARAQEDADGIRGEARNVLQRAIELSEESAEAIGDLTTTVADIMSRLQDARASMAQLLAETPRPPADEVDEVEDDIAAAAGEADEGRPDETADSEDAADTEDAENAEDAEGTDDADDGGHAEAEVVDPTGVPPEPADASATLADELLDRQLGSMFRRHGRRVD
ncbi:hypothetical protein [Nocardioides sp. MH1]|uniref:hypothetical protein n=1 Tax=Nocardioides sp. MH1 TaxID=3242490 RepID=UPI003521DE5C